MCTTGNKSLSLSKTPQDLSLFSLQLYFEDRRNLYSVISLCTPFRRTLCGVRDVVSGPHATFNLGVHCIRNSDIVSTTARNCGEFTQNVEIDMLLIKVSLMRCSCYYYNLVARYADLVESLVARVSKVAALPRIMSVLRGCDCE
jgi:hypothetical protein